MRWVHHYCEVNCDLKEYLVLQMVKKAEPPSGLPIQRAPYGLPALERGVDYTAETHYTHLMSSISESWINLCCICLQDNYTIISQFCTCHDSWAVVTCANLWHDSITGIIITVERVFKRFQSWTRRFFVKLSQFPCAVKKLISVHIFSWKTIGILLCAHIFTW